MAMLSLPIISINRLRPDSDFYYLTGYAEPESVAVLIPDRRHGEYVLFCRENDPVMETWNGHRAGLEGARKIYGAVGMMAMLSFPIMSISRLRRFGNSL